MANVDKRRTDAKVPVNGEPFWFTSAELNTTDAGDVVVLKDFRADGGRYIVQAVFCEILEAWDGSASFIFGTGTLATPALGTVTAVDADGLLISTDITEGTIGMYGQVGSALATALGIGKVFGADVNLPIVGADTTVPVIYGTITATAPTTGKARLHVLLMRLP